MSREFFYMMHQQAKHARRERRMQASMTAEQQALALYNQIVVLVAGTPGTPVAALSHHAASIVELLAATLQDFRDTAPGVRK